MTYNSQTAGIGHSRRHFSVADPLHSTLDNRDCYCTISKGSGNPNPYFVPLMPSRRVSSVLKTMVTVCREVNRLEGTVGMALR